MKAIIAINISPPITYIANFWLLRYGSKCWPIELQDSFKCNISRKKGMMFIFGMGRNINIFYQLILPLWVCTARHAQSTPNKKFAYLCNNSRKTWRIKLLFCLQINMKVFYKVILSFWVYVTRLAQITQDNKFAISLKYINKR